MPTIIKVTAVIVLYVAIGSALAVLARYKEAFDEEDTPYCMAWPMILIFAVFIGIGTLWQRGIEKMATMLKEKRKGGSDREPS